MKRFENLTVLVTGATGGFGSAAARRFAEEGARLVLSDLDAGRLEDFASSLPGEHATLAGSVADEDLHRRIVEHAVSRFGGLDIALNNAGIVHDMARLPDLPSEVARQVIDIDVMGVFYAMKHQLPELDRRARAGGRSAIVNVASVAGVAGAPKLSVYSAAKHAVVGLTRSAAAEYARRGVRVNAVCPSFARTNMVTGAFVKGQDHKQAEDELTRGVPMRRLAEVSEIVEVMLFAADPSNSFMTGQTLTADGGITAI